MPNDFANPLATEPQESDPWDGDYPVFDRKCPRCGRFCPQPVRMIVNGAGEILEANATCKRCGPIKPGVVCWQSDLEYSRSLR